MRWNSYATLQRNYDLGVLWYELTCKVYGSEKDVSSVAESNRKVI